MPTPPRNPYIAGKALGDARGFFGRADVFRLVETVLSSPDQNSVVLFGQRRIGKTSILLNLRSHLPSPPFVTVYFDLMDRARKSLADVLYELAATIAQELQLPQPARADFDETGGAFRANFLPAVYAALDKQKRLVLLFDEFDVLGAAQEEHASSNPAAVAFFPYLRELMTNEPGVGFVFVVGRKAEELGIEFKAAFKASRYYRVSVLDDEAARTLVLLAERQGSLRFAPGAAERILALTARHPYHTQLMCQLLFEKAYQGHAATSDVPQVTVAEVDAIVPKVLEAGENIFEWIWDGLPPAERVIFSAVAAGTTEEGVVSENRLVDILQNQGIRILIRELELAPKTLIEWEMLKQADGGYRFFVELMRRWVLERKPLAKVKDELDRIVPLANTLYQAANGFYRRGMVDNAIAELQQALNINPNHLKARLLLGEVFRTQGKYDDAVRELEEAYRIDSDAARVSLENSLLQRAEVQEKQQQPDAALKDYARVVAIFPSNQAARARQAAIEAEKLASSVTDFERRESWDDAVAAYQRILELNPDNEQLQHALKRATQERDIARRYAEGLGAMQQGKWTEAQRAFADVIYNRPDYKDATKYLETAIQNLRAQERGSLQLLFSRYRFLKALSILVMCVLLLLGGIATYLQLSAFEVTMTNKGCASIAMPTGLQIPGLELPKQIPPNSSVTAKFPRIPNSLIARNNELQISFIGISLAYPIIETGSIVLDGRDLSRLSTPLSLGDQSRHELVFTCQ
ncbi:MAG: tetratricopeptide repeat protein [Chloroflexi bacterium]|nr:tetratricopeptide repeat protein [Chloroflexota bacterium]